MRKKMYSSWYLPGLLILMLLAFSSNTWSQTDVTGKILDGDSGEPLPGVNVIIEGTTSGTITDLDGNFELQVDDPNATISLSFVGYLTETIPLNGQTSIEVTLTPDLLKLEQVVVVGYGTMKRSDLTGSVVSASTEDLSTLKSNNVLESLQGKMPGVNIQTESGRTGSGVSISVRGERSLKARNQPLVIVDGIPYGDDIDINAEEIESLEVLKDAASTAIYGARGANGVILITTKKGEAGKSVVYGNFYHGISQPTQKVPALQREGYLKAAEDALRVSLWKEGEDWESTAGQDPINFLYDANEQLGYELGTDTDWQDLILKNGSQTDILVGVRGGNDKVTYNVSLDYYDEEGVVLNDAFNRLTFKGNVSAKVNKRLTAGMNTIISRRKREGINVSFGNAAGLIALVSPYDSAGVEQYRPYVSKPRVNPSVAAKRDVQEVLETKVFASAFANINIAKGLDFRSNAGVNLRYQTDGRMQVPKDVQESQIRTQIEKLKDVSYTISNVLNYSKDFGAVSTNFMAGNEIQFRIREETEISGTGQPFENKLWYDLAGMEYLTPTNLYEQTSLLSWFGRAGFNYKDIFLLNLSGRWDGASRLAPDHKWAFFPAASGAFRISNLAFMSEVSTISDLKLRLSYGQSGNESVDPYLTSPLLSDILWIEYGRPSIGANADGIPVTGATALQGYRNGDNLPDAKMTWERTTEFNIGLDVGLFDNRVYAFVDAFKTNTKGFLLPVRVPLTSGYDNITTNVGQGETWGIELLLKTVIINNKDLNWTINTSFSASKNKLIEIGDGVYEDRSQDWIVGQPYFAHEINQNTDTWNIYEFDGIWQATAEDSALFQHYNETGSATFAPGEIKVKDKNKDGKIGEADKVLYNNAPKWFGSIESSLSFKNLTLSFNVYARYGNTIRAGAYNFSANCYDNRLDVDYWSPENPSNEWPYVWSEADERGLQNQYILRFTDGTFVKLKHVTLSYRFPKSLISKARLGSLEIYGSVKNPWLIYSNLIEGLDPERNGSSNFPLSRLFLLGINVEF